MAGLIPIMWSTGTGSEVMQRIAVPMIGGMISSTALTLVVIPAVYALIKGFGLPNEPSAAVPVERGREVQTATNTFDRSQAAE
jgi:Cu(I)/Ag(I) efflux system membrane protein CusA/SilA